MHEPMMQRIAGAYVADSARVTGEVTLGRDVNVWFGAAIRGDVAPITIGEGTNVQDCAVIHCDSGHPNTLGAHVTIGHGAAVHGKAVGDCTLIGMHATVLGGTVIGRECLIAAGALLAPGMEVPDGSLVMGVPGRVVGELSDEQRAYVRWAAPHYVELARLYHEQPDDPRVRSWMDAARAGA